MSGAPRGQGRARLLAYGMVRLLLMATVAILLARRPDVGVLILPQAGSMFAQQANGDVVNLYTVQVFNRSPEPREVRITAALPVGASVQPLAPFAHVEAHGLQEGQLLSVPRDRLGGPTTPVRFSVSTDGSETRTIDSSALGPGVATEERT